MQWFPHHVNTEVFKDYQLPKDIDLLLMGDVLPRLYPLRNRILQVMKDKPGFVYHEHPGCVTTQKKKERYFLLEKNMLERLTGLRSSLPAIQFISTHW